ncbi:hypothetical protein SERLA73DRAFT_189114 [Serpula lacrymans var. lacrymans S7.3]|uniref:prephenate dehydratase n=2 Tax=Serpula lacrymans var. lacrymans TaxID=341189 RepID=F8QCV8_SERL3|nr:uncharacterized protein SERLADRAFT_479796 [Serpula lacrymans var. lacrymans S7.9]EGN93973.1 hypothetical protein SERLA73DRAFT_189114 [Serpula lacrymans var. lacrymans S7.3]EGO19339.1 hypothetical protein SERLADRAFT_479796 [Serpula lacrymans var. lacrymans S7.9]
MAEPQIDGQEKPTLAFLGPVGTYSHQAAYDRFGSTVTYSERQTITDVFHALSPSVPLALIPQENSIHGAVIDTYDLLRSPCMGKTSFVRGDVVLSIKHSLVVRKGVRLGEIQHVLSHEQALGQCRAFLREHLPTASLVPYASTAGAARALLSPSIDGLDPLKCAAICSRVIVSILPELEILEEGIQDNNVNYTRFYLLAYSDHTAIPPPSTAPPTQRHALVRISYPPGAMAEKPRNQTRLLNALDLYVIRLDRRPSPLPIPFHDVYFVEVEEETMTDPSWTNQVMRGIQRVSKQGGEANLLGMW